MNRVHIKDIEIKCFKRCLSLFIIRKIQTKATLHSYHFLPIMTLKSKRLITLSWGGYGETVAFACCLCGVNWRTYLGNVTVYKICL